jgi:hypothetical protein
MDFAAHPRWNPFVRSISGIPNVGERLTVVIQPVGGKAMTFHPMILVVAPAQELRWLGRLLCPGIFDGEHYFRIVPLASDRARFEHGERFSGVLVPLAKSSLAGGTKAGFVAMNEALKTRAESNEP